MKIILSPAKKMVSDTDSLAPVNVPKHMDQTAEILSFMKSQSKEELKAVWKCNDKIAALGEDEKHSQITIPVELKAGYNTIRMGNSYNWAPDIDCFTLTKVL